MAAPRWPARAMPAGIGARLFLLITIALLPMLLLLAWVYQQRYETRRVQALQTELEVAQGVSTAFAAYIADVRRQTFAVGQGIITGSSSPARTTQLLTLTAAQYPAISAMNWASPHGRILASSDPDGVGVDLSDRPYIRDIRAGAEWSISNLLQHGRVRGDVTFTVAHGIHDASGQLRGIVVAAINPALLNELVLTQQRPAGGTYAIFDRQGVLVYRYPEIPLTWEERTNGQPQDPLLSQALAGEPAQGIIISAITGRPGFAARVPVAGIHWVAGASRPVDIALAPVRSSLLQDSVLALLVTLLGFGLALLIGRTISHPLRRLQNDVRAFGEGDLAHRAMPTGPREVVQVATMFNRMAVDIQQFQDTLEARVRQRTAELEASNRELESFSYSVAHDLRSPLRSIDGFSKYLLDHYTERLDARGSDYLHRMRAAAQRLGRLIDDLLNLARIGRVELQPERVDLGAMAAGVIADLRRRDPERTVHVDIASDLIATADRALLVIALTHLLENAWKFTSTREEAYIAVGSIAYEGERAYFVRDNGVGFEMEYVDKLFQPFHRLHTEAEFPGTGIGLALVRRIIERHGGRVWAEAVVGAGATVYFTLGAYQLHPARRA